MLDLWRGILDAHAQCRHAGRVIAIVHREGFGSQCFRESAVRFGSNRFVSCIIYAYSSALSSGLSASLLISFGGVSFWGG